MTSGPPAEVAELLAPLAPDIRALVLSVRKLVLATLPGAMEIADSKARVIGYGYGTGYRELVATLILSKKGVKLGLVGGASLPDPDRLLAGSGKVHRHIAFTEPSGVGRPPVEALLRAALQAWRRRKAEDAF